MKVKFLPQNIELEIKPSQSVMNLAHENKLPIHSICNGLPSCAECRVKIVEGDTNVAPPSRKEMNLIGTGHFIDQRRLSCQLVCFGDITVDLSEQLEKGTEGIVPKKFLARANKERPEDYNSVGGVLLEEDGELLKQAEKESQTLQSRPVENQSQGSNRSQGARQDQAHRQDQQQNRQDQPRRQENQQRQERAGQRSGGQQQRGQQRRNEGGNKNQHHDRGNRPEQSSGKNQAGGQQRSNPARANEPKETQTRDRKR